VVAVIGHPDTDRAVEHAARVEDLREALQRLDVAGQGEHLRSVDRPD